MQICKQVAGMLTICERGEDEGSLREILQTGRERQAGAGQTHKEEKAREKRRHSSTLIPYSYYQSRIPEFFPFVPLHWHEEWELNYMLEGEGTVRLGDSEVAVAQGISCSFVRRSCMPLSQSSGCAMIRSCSVRRCSEVMTTGVIWR